MALGCLARSRGGSTKRAAGDLRRDGKRASDATARPSRRKLQGLRTPGAAVDELFSFEFPVWQMVLRGTAVYALLLLVFRFVLRRDIGSMGVADLLFVVLVADASSNAMQGEYRTVTDGLVLVSTLIAWNFALDWLSYRSPAVARFLEPPPEVLIKHGRPMRRAMKREMITQDELEAQLREHGVEDIRKVRVARMEGDGQLSVFTYGGGNAERSNASPRQDAGPPTG
jgi:uncharacterized membrane protein YcaP (DUF421 family)